MKKTYSAGAVVINSQGLILVVEQNGNSWSFPKGHLENDEDALAAAKREVEEESGIKDIKLIRQFPDYQRYQIGLGGKGENKEELKNISMFLFLTEHEELKPNDKTITKARWVGKDKVNDFLTHPKDKEFFSKIMLEL